AGPKRLPPPEGVRPPFSHCRRRRTPAPEPGLERTVPHGSDLLCRPGNGDGRPARRVPGRSLRRRRGAAPPGRTPPGRTPARRRLPGTPGRGGGERGRACPAAPPGRKRRLGEQPGPGPATRIRPAARLPGPV